MGLRRIVDRFRLADRNANEPTARPRHLADAIDALEWSSLNADFEIVDRTRGVVSLSPKRKKVAIVGASLGRPLAPLRDPAWEIWALNLVAPIGSLGRVRADRWFDIHQRCAQSADDLRWIAKCPRPIYVPGDLVDAGPNCVRFPHERLEAKYGAYWACTFAYQIALALDEGFEEIGLFGVELAIGTKRERTVEWANVSWWMGYAEARGVRFRIPSVSMMGRHFARYGIEYQNEIDLVNEYVAARESGDRLDELMRRTRESVGG